MSREFVIQPNCSLDEHSRRNFIVGLSSVMLFIAFGMLINGMWLVMPFLGLDLVLVIYAFTYTGKRCRICERVIIDNNELTILHEEEKAPMCWTFPLYWVRVDLRPNELSPLHGSRLLVGMQGNWIELASFLNQEERVDLASALRAAIVQARQPFHHEGGVT